jgi:hypothetical protein
VIFCRFIPCILKNIYAQLIFPKSLGDGGCGGGGGGGVPGGKKVKIKKFRDIIFFIIFFVDVY